MQDSHLESLYREAQAALKARDYEYAIELLKRSLAVDENYKDTSRLLARAVKLRKRRWYNDPRLWGALGAVVVFILGFMIAPKIGGIFARQAPTVTTSPTATNTAKPTSIPSVIPTRTSRPTSTPTPPPAWVKDFAEPILSTIAKYPPTLQDDLHDNSGGWVQASYCDRFFKMTFVDGELHFICKAERSKMAYTDFVLEFDTRFRQDSPKNSRFSIDYRNYYTFEINIDGNLSLSYNKSTIDLPGEASTNDMTNHILIIAKGNRYAFYINDEPIYYLEDTHFFTREAIRFRTSPTPLTHPNYSIVALDNLKIWDLEIIPNLP